MLRSSSENADIATLLRGLRDTVIQFSVDPRLPEEHQYERQFPIVYFLASLHHAMKAEKGIDSVSHDIRLLQALHGKLSAPFQDKLRELRCIEEIDRVIATVLKPGVDDMRFIDGDYGYGLVLVILQELVNARFDLFGTEGQVWKSQILRADLSTGHFLCVTNAIVSFYLSGKEYTFYQSLWHKNGVLKQLAMAVLRDLKKIDQHAGENKLLLTFETEAKLDEEQLKLMAQAQDAYFAAGQCAMNTFIAHYDMYHQVVKDGDDGLRKRYAGSYVEFYKLIALCDMLGLKRGSPFWQFIANIARDYPGRPTESYVRNKLLGRDARALVITYSQEITRENLQGAVNAAYPPTSSSVLFSHEPRFALVSDTEERSHYKRKARGPAVVESSGDEDEDDDDSDDIEEAATASKRKGKIRSSSSSQARRESEQFSEAQARLAKLRQQEMALKASVRRLKRTKRELEQGQDGGEQQATQMTGVTSPEVDVTAPPNGTKRMGSLFRRKGRSRHKPAGQSGNSTVHVPHGGTYSLVSPPPPPPSVPRAPASMPASASMVPPTSMPHPQQFQGQVRQPQMPSPLPGPDLLRGLNAANGSVPVVHMPQGLGQVAVPIPVYLLQLQQLMRLHAQCFQVQQPPQQPLPFAFLQGDQRRVPPPPPGVYSRMDFSSLFSPGASSSSQARQGGPAQVPSGQQNPDQMQPRPPGGSAQ